MCVRVNARFLFSLPTTSSRWVRVEVYVRRFCDKASLLIISREAEAYVRASTSEVLTNLPRYTVSARAHNCLPLPLPSPQPPHDTTEYPVTRSTTSTRNKSIPFTRLIESSGFPVHTTAAAAAAYNNNAILNRRRASLSIRARNRLALCLGRTAVCQSDVRRNPMPGVTCARARFLPTDRRLLDRSRGFDSSNRLQRLITENLDCPFAKF